jgi:hypothetical protein
MPYKRISAMNEQLKIHRSLPDICLLPDGQLAIREGNETIPVKVRPCFPWTQPKAFLSLRDEDKKERALVLNLDDLTAESRGALEQVLSEAAFTFEINRIKNLGQDFELRVWEVETQVGPRTFLTKYDDFPEEFSGNGLMIQDLSGDIYVVRDIESLDPKSQQLLYSFQ